MLPTDFPFRVTHCAELIRDSGTYAFPLMVILAAAYDDLFEIDPVELYIRIEEDFQARLTEEGENRVQAAILALETDMFYDDALTTRSISMALYEGDLGDLPNGMLEDVYLPEIIWAAYEIGLMREDEEDFSIETQAYVDSLIKDAADEVDVDEEEVLPYYAKTLMDSKLLLKQQLQKIGRTLEDGLFEE